MDEATKGILIYVFNEIILSHFIFKIINNVRKPSNNCCSLMLFCSIYDEPINRLAGMWCRYLVLYCKC